MKNNIIWKARNTDLYEYFQSKGYNLKKEPDNRFRVKGFGGLIIHNCTYKHFASGKSGTAVDCLIDVLGYDFKTAIKELTGSISCSYENKKKQAKQLVFKDEFNLPKLNSNYSKVFAYLSKTRKIDKDIITYLLNKKKLFQDTKGNCVFPWYLDNKIVGAELVGTLDQVRFKGICKNSKYGFGFSIKKGTPNKIYFFESAIDLLSFITIYKKNNLLDNAKFVSMGGLKAEVIRNMLNLHKSSLTSCKPCLCTDTDKAGLAFIEKVKSELKVEKVDFDILLPKKTKDWNEYLLIKAFKKRG